MTTECAATALVTADGNFTWLAVRKKAGELAGLWETPAGRVEPGETPMQAAVREVKEEAGLEIAPERFRPMGSMLLRLRMGDVQAHLYVVVLTDEERPLDTEPTERGRWCLMAMDTTVPNVTPSAAVLLAAPRGPATPEELARKDEEGRGRLTVVATGTKVEPYDPGACRDPWDHSLPPPSRTST